MSITINQQTTGYVSAFNPIDFLIETNNVQPIFEYQIRPKVGGVTIAQINKPKSIIDGKCWFDVQRVIQNLVSYDINGIVNGTLSFYKALNTHKEFIVEFAEFSGTTYSNVASGSPINSNNIIALNTAYDFLDTFQSGYLTDFIIDGLGTKNFLTGLRGAPIRIRENQSFELGLITVQGTTVVSKLEIKTYNQSGGLIGTYQITNSFSDTINLDEVILSIQVGTDKLNSQSLSSGSQPVITSSVAYYEVYTVSSFGSSRTSEIITFTIDRSCLRYEPIRVFWLNKYGRIDSFSMNLANDKSFEVAKDYYQKEAGAIVGNSIVRSPYESGDTAFNTKIDTFVKLRTDYISEIESGWLSEFVKSPIAWMYMDNKLTTIKVNNSNYSIKNPKRDGLFIEEFDVQLTNSSYRQKL